MNPTNLEDCFRLAKAIQDMAPPGLKLLFSTRHGPNIDYHIPITFTYDSCSVIIGPLSEHEDAEDMFYARYLSRTIRAMATKCVVPWPHLGGFGELGSEKALAFAVLGRKTSATRVIDLKSNLTAIH